METTLRKAAERMPLPVTKFESIAARVQKKPKPMVRHRRLRPVVIVLAVVILLAGCATAYGAYKASRGTWNVMSSNFFIDAEIEMGKYGVVLPEEYDGVDFREMSVGSSVPHGISWIEAVFSGYKSVHAGYGADDLCYSVAVGDTEDEYWVAYFGYESEDLWRGDGDYLAVEYEGYTIHTGYYLSTYSDDKTRKATWVDPEREICVSVHGSDGRDPLPLAKWIIDNLE